MSHLKIESCAAVRSMHCQMINYRKDAKNQFSNSNTLELSLFDKPPFDE